MHPWRKKFSALSRFLRRESLSNVLASYLNVRTKGLSLRIDIDQPPLARNIVWERTVANPDEVNSANTYYIHVGSISDTRLRTTLRLLVQILSEPCFDILRTQEQLGYVVFCSEWQMVESIGLRFLIQSEKDPKYLEARIEAFLVHMRGIIEAMDDTQFEAHKKSLIQKWTEKLKNMQEETSLFWAHIESGYLDFTRREHDATVITSVTKEDVLTLFKEFVDPTLPTRSKFSVHMLPQKPPAIKLSQPAAQAFLVALRKAGVPVDEEDFNSQCADEPPATKIRAHWEKTLRDQAGVEAEELLAQFDELVRAYPSVGQGAVELGPNVEFIKDGSAFKETLPLSEPAKPVENVELFQSKF